MGYRLVISSIFASFQGQTTRCTCVPTYVYPHHYSDHSCYRYSVHRCVVLVCYTLSNLVQFQDFRNPAILLSYKGKCLVSHIDLFWRLVRFSSYNVPMSTIFVELDSCVTIRGMWQLLGLSVPMMICCTLYLLLLPCESINLKSHLPGKSA